MSHQGLHISRRFPWLLLAGVVLLVLSQLRGGIGLLAFVAAVPFLKYLRDTSGFRSRLTFYLALHLGWTVATLKLVSEPVPAAFAILFAIPVALVHGAAFLLSDTLRRRVGEWLGVLSFPAIAVVAEFVQHRFTDFGSWGAAAYTQLDNLPLLQVASITGMAGVSFIVYFVASAVESAWSRPSSGRRTLVAAVAVLLAAVAFGSLRLTFAKTGETELVAAIGTDGTFGSEALPTAEEIASIDDALFARTAAAAEAGAKLVAWTEVATIVFPESEPAFHERLKKAAAQHGIEIVAGYAMPLSTTPFRYENKYAWVRPDGTIDHTYLKNYPVPGEPAVRGDAGNRVVETAAGRAIGALCYDYDFPSLALRHARLGIDLAVVPSSDWRGIAPLHTQMASLRAIEGGFSLLRSTRFGQSAGFDRYGRTRGWESSFDSERRILLVGLPSRGARTSYSRVGDVFVVLCAAYVMLVAMLAVWSERMRWLPVRQTASGAEIG